MTPDLVPALDPTPIPGPPWLFHVLLVFTFVLHVLFMNLALGGTILAAVAAIGARGRPADPRHALADRMVGINTYAISMAITTGVAPLLFVQVLYPQFFYTATILVGEVWLLFLGLLLAGYYAVYAWKASRERRGTDAPAGWLVLASALFLCIAATHVAVHLVHASPADWSVLEAAPLRVLADPTYVPRLLHFVLAAIGTSALVLTWWSVRQVRRGVAVETNEVVSRGAWRWVLWTTVLQVADGFVLLIVLPRDVLLSILRGGVATLAPLAAAIALGIGLLVMIARVDRPAERPGLVSGVFAAVLATVGAMAITRHQVRAAYLDPWVDTGAIPWVSQWGNFVLFAVLLVGALATVAWIARAASGPGAAIAGRG